MNLHQFRFVQEAARRGLNLTEAAKAVSNATQTLVDAAKPSKQEEESTSVDYSNISLTQARRDEMEAQVNFSPLSGYIDDGILDII